MPVAELDRQRERRQRRDAAQTDEPLDDVEIRWRGGQLCDCFIECLASALRVEHPAVALVEHDRQRPALEALPAKPRVVCSVHAVASYTRPWRSSSFESRWRARIRSPRASSRARTRSRAASSSGEGTRIGVISPSRSSLASRSASRRSVLTRSAAARIRDGAATTQLIPASAHARASRYPVGPASYTTRTGAGNVCNQTTVASAPGGTRSDAPHHCPRRSRPRQPSGRAHRVRPSYLRS